MDSDTNNHAKDTEEEKKKRRDVLWRRHRYAFIFAFALLALLLLISIFVPAMASEWHMRIFWALVVLDGLSWALIEYYCGLTTIWGYNTFLALLYLVIFFYVFPARDLALW